ncbi:glutamate racemase [Acidipropionibacterium acidipropionici]|uniref:glutamate racemase n=1 Tax=Acidipropionibacterium acidipropionici TaxID=1748 RepID=UPI0003F92A5A|nr:glutamate racemase [Acidipropionibacterium acidipropionici]ALN15561.1 glutamate racemase [Acidipropionibacterium acidipropionici]APZ08692.1 glutamate racemase [Acidipropionibacterium acidipropionici]
MTTDNPDGIGYPIGIFDSGFGGLTVARAAVDLMPNEDIVYLGDTARAPYGEKRIAQVREYALQCLDRLDFHGVKALVIACNTASSAVLRDARERYDVPVIDVIMPAARRASLATRNGRIGVICTEATARSRSYEDALAAVPGVTVTTIPCPRFVEYVERGVTGGPELEALARSYLEPIREAGCDTLILGCTHYPLLAGLITLVLGDEVTLVSSSEECARASYTALTRLGILHTEPREPSRYFLTTGNAEKFERLGRRLMQGFVHDVHRVGMDDQPAPLGDLAFVKP